MDFPFCALSHSTSYYWAWSRQWNIYRSYRCVRVCAKAPFNLYCIPNIRMKYSHFEGAIRHTFFIVYFLFVVCFCCSFCFIRLKKNVNKTTRWQKTKWIFLMRLYLYNVTHLAGHRSSVSHKYTVSNHALPQSYGRYGQANHLNWLFKVNIGIYQNRSRKSPLINQIRDPCVCIFCHIIRGL